MTGDEHLKYGNIVQAIECWLDVLCDDSENMITRRAAERLIISVLQSHQGKRVSEEVRNTIRKAIGESTWFEKSNTFVSYEPYRDEIGATFGLFFTRSESQPIGVINRFVVRKESDYSLSNDERTSEEARSYRTIFFDSLALCATLITDCKDKNAYFSTKFLETFKLSLSTQFIENIPIIYEGLSAGLSIGIATFSGLTEMPIPVQFAFTGQLDRYGKVSWIAGLETKTDAVLKELPEVEFIITAEDCRRQINNNEDKMIFVKHFKDALEHVFPDWKDEVKEKLLPGEVRYSWSTRQIIGGDANLLLIKYKGRLHPQIIENMQIDIESIPKPGEIVIIDGAGPGWLVSSIVADIKNKVSSIAVHDPKVVNKPGAVVVFSQSEKYKCGQILQYPSSP